MDAGISSCRVEDHIFYSLKPDRILVGICFANIEKNRINVNIESVSLNIFSLKEATYI